MDNQATVAEIGLDLSPEFHGRKWAKSIYAKFISEVLEPQDITAVELRVLKVNTRAQNLYKDMGFLVYEETDLDYSMKANVIEILKRLSASNSIDDL